MKHQLVSGQQIFLLDKYSHLLALALGHRGAEASLAQQLRLLHGMGRIWCWWGHSQIPASSVLLVSSSGHRPLEGRRGEWKLLFCLLNSTRDFPVTATGGKC